MSIRIFLVMILTGLLFGCSSDTVKEDEPVQVEDLSGNVPDASGTEDGGAQAYGTDDASTSAFSQLDDPQSPLSVRIIYFEYDSSEIKAEYRSVIEAHAAYLSANSNTIITLEGHADERGTREYNMALGERRANAVREFLMLEGVNGASLEVISYGEESPAAQGSDEASYALNRRVEMK